MTDGPCDGLSGLTVYDFDWMIMCECVCLWHVCIMPYVHSVSRFHTTRFDMFINISAAIEVNIV